MLLPLDQGKGVESDFAFCLCSRDGAGVLPGHPSPSPQKGLAALCWRFICPHCNILLRTYSVPGAILGDWVMSTPGVGSQ